MSIVLSEPTAIEAGKSTDSRLVTASFLENTARRFCGAIERATSNLDPDSFQKLATVIIALVRDVSSAKAEGRELQTFGFTVCENFFPIRISPLDERIYDADGAEAWAITDPVTGEIVIWEGCPRHEWLHTLMHEFHRVWAIYHYEPESQTAAAMNFANECGEFNRQFAAQGGIATLLALKPTLRWPKMSADEAAYIVGFEQKSPDMLAE